MTSLKDRLYLTTISPDAEETARQFGLGLEIAEFCTAENMDVQLSKWDRVARDKLKEAGADRCVLHAPFYELTPAAIDPLVLDVTKRRYRHAREIALSYGARRMVVHSGFMPYVYFPEFFIERSVLFYREFLDETPEDFTVLVENVLESNPDALVEIVRQVGDKRLRLCLDVGHANLMKQGITLEEWLEKVLPFLGHAHLHNNHGKSDEHNPLGDGEIDMDRVMRRLLEGPGDATITIESRGSRTSMAWLQERGYL